MQEFYIRRPGDEEASGPFDIDQIVSLIEVGKLEPSAFYYDVDQETWATIESNAALMEVIAPQKQKLVLKTAKKPAEPAEAPAESDEESAPKTKAEAKAEAKAEKVSLKKKAAAERKPEPISVQDMLAQAEGRDRNDPHGKSPAEKQATAAFLGMRFATLITLLNVIFMGLLELDLLKTANVPMMIKSPYIATALVDVFLLLFLTLQVTQIFPLVRFRAALGLGFSTLLFLASGDTVIAIANALLMVCLYASTIVIDLRKQIVVGALSLGAAAAWIFALKSIFA